MHMRKFFQVLLLIFVMAFAGGCGVSNESSIENLPVIRINANEGGNKSFTTSDGVIVDVEVPPLNETGEVTAKEFSFSINESESPLVRKVSNGIVLTVNVSNRSKADNEREFLLKPITVTLQFPKELADKIHKHSVYLYRFKESENILEKYPATYKNNMVSFEVTEVGNFKFLLLDDAFIPSVREMNNTNNVTKSFGNELPAKPELNNVKVGPIHFDNPIKENEYVDFSVYEPSIFKLSEEVVNDISKLRNHILIKLDGEEISVYKIERNELDGGTIDFTIPKKLKAGKHKLEFYTITNLCSDSTYYKGLGPICSEERKESFSTYFLVVPGNATLSLEGKVKLLEEYAPIVEFGDLSFFEGKIQEDILDYVKQQYGNYTREFYYPIDIADLEVCNSGEEDFNFEALKNDLPYWLKSLSEDEQPEKLLFVVCNDKDKCYKTSCLFLDTFYSTSHGKYFNKGREGFEYAIAYLTTRGTQASGALVGAGSVAPVTPYPDTFSTFDISTLYYANGAQFITKDYLKLKNIKSKILATYKEDSDYIYLQYWFYYPYDPKTPEEIFPKLFAQHPGDAEVFTLIIDKDTRNPLYGFFGHHNNDQKFAYMWNDSHITSVKEAALQSFMTPSLLRILLADPKIAVAIGSVDTAIKSYVLDNPAFVWNKKGFKDEVNGIGGAIVSWKKMDKIGTHPVLYIALGSHGIYPRRGIYAVDDTTVDSGDSRVDADLVEVAGGGCRISFANETISLDNPCEISGILKVVSFSSPIEPQYLHLFSPLNTLGESFTKDHVQNDVRFFPYSEFFYSDGKLHCLNKTSSNYDLIAGNIKLKAKDDGGYCKSIVIDKYLFPPEDYLPEKGDFLSIEVNSNTAKIEGFVNPVYWDSNGNIHDGNTHREIVGLLPEEGYKLLVNWDISSENSTWKEISAFNKTVLLTGNVKFSSEHTYATSGNHTIGLRLVTPNGAYVEKTYEINVTQEEAETEKGNVQGAVKDAITNEPIQGVKVSLFRNHDGACDVSSTAETVTDQKGNYKLENIPVGNYTITFSKEGYLPATGNIEVKTNSTITYPTLMQIDTEHSGNGTLQGIVKDAINGQPVSGVSIKVFEGINNISGEPVATVITLEDGSYQLELKAGYYTFLLSKDDYRETNYSLSLVGNTVTNREFTISPILPANKVLIVLTWGETPPDLDAHLVKIKNGNQEYHLFWYYAESCPDHGNCHGSPTQEASLDIDAIHSFGPETITIHNIDANATYKYYVHDYSTSYSTGGGGEDSTVLANSGATVKVHWGNQTYTYPVPNLPGTAWKVFEIVNGTFIPCSGDNCVFVVSSVTDSQFGTRTITSVNPDVELFKNLPVK